MDPVKKILGNEKFKLGEIVLDTYHNEKGILVNLIDDIAVVEHLSSNKPVTLWSDQIKKIKK